ncbi:glycerol-3-phosphate 1-O-acyltransferase PlsY [Coxiella endosymbiont of Amblyomma americanum]|uniref:glycerol-3-phosphate 1-O-acyltransferase PlsY n=1 Tax=Coxiella endosymbiont of Amblyomma americanum TaxID=325775 RepID=UPI00057CB3A2|nr:glycerol-3-phosphate 1-O-acyltransferase PlsY [Coxiella endosymbiont of Amblyomma americanum]AJC50625.1 acyl-phosphate glycerol 3-phosphate acyltransferase [Coxiella endosymbiont of Amblyomma americanum]AUJ58953.1 acyl-phosphate glycerol 3-phosphate acyltransferase [Coxiella-like endosymbiont of Amblyomma americanum]
MIKGFFVSFIMAYCVGSFSCAVIFSKLAHLPDPRTVGSGNPGTTNALRTSGKKLAFLVLLGDSLKGLFAVVISHFFLGVCGIYLSFIALAAVIGHIFPLYFEFKGGKGIATMFGAFLGLSFSVSLCLIITWLIVAVFCRFSSVAALITAVAAPIYMVTIGSHSDYFFPVFLISILIIWKHLENIKNLQKGVEKKIQF